MPRCDSNESDLDRAGVEEEQIEPSMVKGLMSERQHKQIKQLKELTTPTKVMHRHHYHQHQHLNKYINSSQPT